MLNPKMLREWNRLGRVSNSEPVEEGMISAIRDRISAMLGTDKDLAGSMSSIREAIVAGLDKLGNWSSDAWAAMIAKASAITKSLPGISSEMLKTKLVAFAEGLATVTKGLTIAKAAPYAIGGVVVLGGLYKLFKMIKKKFKKQIAKLAESLDEADGVIEEGIMSVLKGIFGSDDRKFMKALKKAAAEERKALVTQGSQPVQWPHPMGPEEPAETEFDDEDEEEFDDDYNNPTDDEDGEEPDDDEEEPDDEEEEEDDNDDDDDAEDEEEDDEEEEEEEEFGESTKLGSLLRQLREAAN